MAFNLNELRSVATLGSMDTDTVLNKKWALKTADAAATVAAAGYFNGARGLLQVNDLIEAVTGVGGSVVVKAYIVATVPATGNVTVAAVTYA